MNIFIKIWRWFFRRKKKSVPFVGALPPPDSFPKPPPLTKKDIKRKRINAWVNKPIRKKKAIQLPLTKMLNPEKYF